MPTNRQTIPRAEREAEILDAAQAAFADDGFEATTVAAVAERAGMTPANVHYYFATKDDLFAAVVDRAYRSLLAELDRVPGAVERLRRYVLLHRRTFALRGAVQSVAARNATLAACLVARDRWVRRVAGEVAPGPLERDVLVAVVTGLIEHTTPHDDPVAVLEAAIAGVRGRP
ncbi:MAG: TetR/AcrR family transcriptional regulator [Acidimicrobiia bacterium]